MASTRLRAKWLPKLAKAIGWAPQRLRNFYNKRGMYAPFTSELAGMQLLVDAGISIAKYRPTEDGVNVKVVPSPKASPGKAGTVTPAGVTAPANKSIVENGEKRTAWDLRLISRLAALTPLGRTKDGKKLAKAILVKHNYPGPWEDEARALQCFVDEGISIAEFEYANSPGKPGGPVLLGTPAETYEALLQQYNELAERHKKTLEALGAKDKEITDLTRLKKMVKEMLRQYENKILNPKRFPELVKPLGFPIDALNEIREYESAELH
jgi:hypothetical protein